MASEPHSHHEGADACEDSDSEWSGYEGAAEYEGATRVFALVKEYKALKEEVPAGVYVMPAIDDVYTWHGVVFVHRGPYAYGVFRFVVSIPEQYPHTTAPPAVRFLSHVFHPAVDPKTGELALPEKLQTWNCDRHKLLDVLLAVHDTLGSARFYGVALNTEAETMLRSAGRVAEFEALAQECARVSRDRALDNPPGSSIRFSRWHAQLQQLRMKVLGRQGPMQAPPSPQRRASEQALGDDASATEAPTPNPDPDVVPRNLGADLETAAASRTAPAQADSSTGVTPLHATAQA